MVGRLEEGVGIVIPVLDMSTTEDENRYVNNKSEKKSEKFYEKRRKEICKEKHAN